MPDGDVELTTPRGDVADTRFRYGTGADGIERLEASLRGDAFAPHRHDTYAIGITLAGVQSFRYRGEQHHCTPGEAHVLHPDEVHDGAAGTDDGFRYRIVYLDPALVQQAQGGGPLPFVTDPVIRRQDVPPALVSRLRTIDDPIEDFERVEMAAELTAMLVRHAPPSPALSPAARGRIPLDALRKVRELINDDPAVRHPADRYEDVSGLDRWTVARQFRVAYGTSPTRYRTLRQLARARDLMVAGHTLAETAVHAGFADQSHLSRMFKRAYGMTPARWAAAASTGPHDRSRPPVTGAVRTGT